jgi:hypothetical protein
MAHLDSNEYIYGLIGEGEHTQQDFKFEISDARKIAKSLSAFSNTIGGRLLIGVKDNGRIAGIRSDEEIYMIEAAAQVYCEPQVEFGLKNYRIEGRTVLEVTIPEAENKPVLAKDENGKGWAYLRIADENILATSIHLRVWREAKSPKGCLVTYTDREQQLLSCMQEQGEVSFSRLCRLSGLPRPVTESLLAKFIRFEIAETVFRNHRFYFRLA